MHVDDNTRRERERERKDIDRIVPKSYVKVAISSCRAYNEALYHARIELPAISVHLKINELFGKTVTFIEGKGRGGDLTRYFYRRTEMKFYS